VLALQQRLVEIGYWMGTPDGVFGRLTEQAVWALQKAAGLQRDAVVGTATRAALAAGVRPLPRSTRGRVVEIDKQRQLLMVVQDGVALMVLNTSTGSGRFYQRDGRWYVASTPSGEFRVYHQIDGLRVSPLGVLWRPKYFHGGIAVHGSPSIPPWPASHGCVRLSNPAIDHLWADDLVPIGTAVWVY
jgi:lipoprotein-anchoring transpeptidase ErfK/SrfK